MNRLALHPTDMFIGRHALIGTSMAMDCFCRTNALALLVCSLFRPTDASDVNPLGHILRDHREPRPSRPASAASRSCNSATRSAPVHCSTGGQIDRMNQSAGAGIKARQGSMRQARAARPYRAPGSDLHVRSRGLGEAAMGRSTNSLPGRNQHR